MIDLCVLVLLEKGALYSDTLYVTAGFKRTCSRLLSWLLYLNEQK